MDLIATVAAVWLVAGLAASALTFAAVICSADTRRDSLRHPAPPPDDWRTKNGGQGG